jgi:galactose-6-phosphate isomerase
MALLDVSDVLLDPDFADSLQFERLTTTVGDDGIATQTPKITRFSGVVTSGSGDQLRRFDAGQRVEGSIVVHCRQRLNEADVVIWRARRFTVMSVDDYSNFGRGFVAAHCELIPLSG